MKDCIIFCQAPYDVQYVLSLYDRNIESYNITIIVVNVINNYKFIKSLGLTAKVYFLPLNRLNSPISLIKSLMSLNKFYKEKLSFYRGSCVYFFSISHDYVTAILVHKLISKNNVFYMDIYGIKNAYLDCLRTSFKTYFFEILTGVHIRFFSGRVGSGYDYILSPSISSIELGVVDVESYKFKPLGDSDKRKVLIYEGKGEIAHLTTNYHSVLKNVILILSSRFDVYIKPHPRLGATDLIYDMGVEVIPAEIPAELLDTKDYSIIFGFGSTSIASQIHSNKYSLLDLCEFSEKDDVTVFKSYLEGVTSSGFVYLSNIAELKTLVEDGDFSNA